MTDCYEHFDFDIEHLHNDHKLFSPISHIMYRITPQLWNYLLLLKETQVKIKEFRESPYYGVEHVDVYQDLLNEYARLKKNMQKFANEFCYTYKAYSLN